MVDRFLSVLQGVHEVLHGESRLNLILVDVLHVLLVFQLENIDLSFLELSSKRLERSVSTEISQVSSTISICCINQLVPVNVLSYFNTLEVDAEKLLSSNSSGQRDVYT